MPTRRAPAPHVSTTALESMEPIIHDQIATRAFELYLERGGEHGHDVDDWLRAEREVRENVSEAMSV